MTATASATTTPVESTTDWYRQSADDVCRQLDVDPAVGLSADAVLQRRQQYGPNKLAEEAKEPGWRAFLRQYRDLMQLVLLGAAIVSIVALQDISTGLVVIALTVVNALMGLHQEGKAAESVAALRQMLIMTANVRRDGQRVQIPAEELVPGDIVGFEAGDKVAADGRILVAATLEIEEAGLTGESTPVAKIVDPVTAGERSARRPRRHGLHELAGDPRPRRDRRHGDRDVERGRPHLRNAERRRAGEVATHQATRSAHRDHHDHGGGRPGADHHLGTRPRRGLRLAVPDRHHAGDRGDPDGPPGRGDDAALGRDAAAR